PLARIFDGGTNDFRNNTMSGRLSLDIVPLSGLTITGILAPHFSFNKRKNYQLALPMTAWNDPNEITGYVSGLKSTRLDESRSENKNFTSQILANYSTSINNHNIAILAGYEYYYA